MSSQLQKHTAVRSLFGVTAVNIFTKRTINTFDKHSLHSTAVNLLAWTTVTSTENVLWIRDWQMSKKCCHLMSALAASASSRCCECTQQVAALFCTKYCHGRHLESMTSYHKSYYCQSKHFYSKNNPAKFHPNPI